MFIGLVFKFPFFLIVVPMTILTQAGALENIVKASQLEIIELRHSVEDLRYFL